MEPTLKLEETLILELKWPLEGVIINMKTDSDMLYPFKQVLMMKKKQEDTTLYIIKNILEQTVIDSMDLKTN